MRAEFSGDGWESSGIGDDRLLTETLTLVRARASTDTSAANTAQQFAPFVRVQRSLNLGLDWTAQTNVQRLAPDEGGFTVRCRCSRATCVDRRFEGRPMRA